MKILAFDQSTRMTGWALSINGELSNHGVIDADLSEKNPFARMADMYFQMSELVDRLQPDWLCFEDTQKQGSIKVYGLLSNLCGVCISIAIQRNLPYTIVPPNTWKSCFGVHGKKREEQKASTRALVSERYGLDVEEDEADAIGQLYWATTNLKGSN